MTQSILPLYNWGMGTTLIAIFVLVCITLTVMVFKFVLTGKSKDEIRKAQEKEAEDNQENA